MAPALAEKPVAVTGKVFWAEEGNCHAFETVEVVLDNNQAGQWCVRSEAIKKTFPSYNDFILFRGKYDTCNNQSLRAHPWAKCWSGLYEKVEEVEDSKAPARK